MTHQEVKQPGLGRVIGALLYDGLALIALFMIAGFIFIPALGHPPATLNERLVFQVYLFVITYLFFCWFWTHGGQTLGMRAWRLKLVDEQGMIVTWPTATKRFFFALLSWLPLGLGYFWIIFNSQGRSWHDLLSKTRLIHIPKQQTGTKKGVA